MNILNKADEIVNKRKEEKERFYGPFEEGMENYLNWYEDMYEN